MESMNREQAHKLVTATVNIADHFNETGFLEDSPALLAGWKATLVDSLRMHKDLYHLSKANAAYQGWKMVAKMLLRISYLTHKGRPESSKERFDAMRDFDNRNGGK